jgi:nicotinamide-nucleotide amidase
MPAEIIAIGDELTSGQRLDTNSQWLAQRLGELGVPVYFHTTVSDDLAANVRVFREAADRADLIVCTGGLGPTADDLTRQALAEAAGVDLVLDEPALEQIRALFARRKRPMPPRNEVQAWFPRGSRVIPNPHGSAPGIDFDLPRSGRTPARFFCLPGVPAEMQEMWEQTVAAAIAQQAGGGRVILHRQIRCFGVGESDLEQMLPDLIARGREPSVGITVSKATITLRITAHGASAEAGRAAIEPTAATIYRCLGELVFGEGEDELQHAVVRLLLGTERTLALAEWGTAGLVTSWLSDVPGYERVLRGSTVLTSDLAATSFLGAAPPAEDRVKALAMACRERFAADYGVAIGPFPQADSATSQPGNLQLALATRDKTLAVSTSFAGHPEILKPRAGKQALNLLRLHLLRSDAP